MAISTRTLVQPAGEPLSLSEAKLACRIDEDITQDDDFIAGLIRRARTYVEQSQGIALVSRTVLAAWDRFPRYGSLSLFDYGTGGMGWLSYSNMRTPRSEKDLDQRIDRRSLRFPEGPLQSVTSIKYTDLANTLQTVTPSIYRVDALSEPGRISPAFGQIWPYGLHQSQSVKIQAIVGHGPSTTIPLAISAGPQTVTPASMYGIFAQDLANDPFYPGTVLAIGEGQYRELVTVTGATGSTFTASFAIPHLAGASVKPGISETLMGEMLMLISHWYTNRDAVNDGSFSVMPLAAEAFHWLNWNGELR